MSDRIAVAVQHAAPAKTRELTTEMHVATYACATLLALRPGAVMKQASIGHFFGAPKAGAAAPKPVPPPPPPPPPPPRPVPDPAAAPPTGPAAAAPASLPDGVEWFADAAVADAAAEPAAAVAAEPAAKKAKKAAPGVLCAASFKKLRAVPIPAAAYVDQCLAWAALRDGRELLIADEVWHVPPTFPAAPAEQLARVDPHAPVGGRYELRDSDADSYGHFAPLPGLDAMAQVVTPPKGTPSLLLRRLPDLAPLARCALPFEAEDVPSLYGGARDVRRLCAAPGGLLLALTPRWLFLLRATEDSLTLLLRADLEDVRTPLGRELHRGPPVAEGWSGQLRKPTLVSAAALWVPLRGEGAGVPQALLANAGRVLRVPLAHAPGPLAVAAVRCDVHCPMRLSDKDAYVSSVALWHRGGGAAALVSTGSDGDAVITPLHDGAAFADAATAEETRWHATRNGSGGSKGYPYAPSGLCAVHSGAGVVVTGSYNDPQLHAYDLASDKCSQAGKQLAVAKQLAGGRRTTIFLADVAPRSGRIATSNSNDHDDPTLVILCPAGN